MKKIFFLVFVLNSCLAPKKNSSEFEMDVKESDWKQPYTQLSLWVDDMDKEKTVYDKEIKIWDVRDSVIIIFGHSIKIKKDKIVAVALYNLHSKPIYADSIQRIISKVVYKEDDFTSFRIDTLIEQNELDSLFGLTKNVSIDYLNTIDTTEMSKIGKSIEANTIVLSGSWKSRGVIIEVIEKDKKKKNFFSSIDLRDIKLKNVNDVILLIDSLILQAGRKSPSFSDKL